MIDISQILTDPTLCAQAQAFDLHKLVGLAGAPFIEQAVEYLKYNFLQPINLTKLSSLMALLLGVAVNVGMAYYFGTALQDAVVVGLFTGAAASGWHLVNKDPTATVVNVQK